MDMGGIQGKLRNRIEVHKGRAILLCFRHFGVHCFGHRLLSVISFSSMALDSIVLRNTFVCLRDGKTVQVVQGMMQGRQEVANMSH